MIHSSESAPGPVLGYAVGNLFHWLARTTAAGDHPAVTCWSRQRCGGPAPINAVVVFAVLAALAADGPGRVPALKLTVTYFACPRRNAIWVKLGVLVQWYRERGV